MLHAHGFLMLFLLMVWAGWVETELGQQAEGREATKLPPELPGKLRNLPMDSAVRCHLKRKTTAASGL